METQNRKPSFDADELTSRDFYLDSYAHFLTHEVVLRDEVRTLAYRSAICDNSHLFKGKVVLDVGCGTGIMSMFAAIAGAKRVFGIECSKFVKYTKKIVADNHLSGIVTIIEGKVEEVTLPDGIKKVDIIISEWMGYCLFFESMLGTVMFARDKWLKPDGLLFPDKACLYITAIEDRSYKDEKINWWDSVYGFDMSSIRRAAISQALVDEISRRQVVTNNAVIKTIDLYTATTADLEFTSEFTLRAFRDDYIQALVAYFKVDFSNSRERVRITTSPNAPSTHWKHTVFYLNSWITCKRGETVEGTFTMRPNPQKSSELNFKISVNFQGELSSLEETNSYRMSKYQ